MVIDVDRQVSQSSIDQREFAMKKSTQNVPVVQPPDNSAPLTGQLLPHGSTPGNAEEWFWRKTTHVAVSALRFEATTIEETRTRIK